MTDPKTIEDLVAAAAEKTEAKAKLRLATENGQSVEGDQSVENEGVSLDDFYAYMPMHSYLFVPSRDPWPAASVNARIAPIPDGEVDGKPKTVNANIWLDQNRPVEQMTWAPGLPMLINDRLISEGGWINRKGVNCFNLYRPPTIEHGDAD